MTTLATERGSHQHLLAQQLEQRARLAGLRRRLAEIDAVATPRAHSVVAVAAERAARELASIEAALAGEVPVELPSPSDDPQSTEQAKLMMRARLQHLLIVVERHAPPSCDAAAGRLRRAVELELARLDGHQHRRMS